MDGWRGQSGHSCDGCHLSAVMVCVMLGVSVPAVAGGDIRFLLGLFLFFFFFFGRGTLHHVRNKKKRTRVIYNLSRGRSYVPRCDHATVMRAEVPLGVRSTHANTGRVR